MQKYIVSEIDQIKKVKNLPLDLPVPRIVTTALSVSSKVINLYETAELLNPKLV